MQPVKGAVLLSTLATLALAVPKPGHPSLSTVIEERCFTRRGTSSVRWVPTTTTKYRNSHTFTVYSTFTPTDTVAPTGSTVQVTSTDTVTALQKTDTTTVTLTATAFATTTSTSTSTEIDTATTTLTTTFTSTIPTAAGFTPIASVPSVQSSGGEGGTPVVERDALPGMSEKPQPVLSTNREQCPRTYPQRIRCLEHVDVYSTKTVIVTASQTATVTAQQPPAYTTATSTIETTTTITPADTTVTADASTTTTETTTATTTTTQTTTTTTTSTSFAASQTVYAACAANNVIDTVNNQLVAGIAAETAFSQTGDSDMTDPVACCNICQSTPNCAGWFISNPGGAYDCIVIPDAGTCQPTESVWFFWSSGAPYDSFYVGDGPCGQGTYSGSSS